ncbi:MAG: molybdopterin cofactor-binding domain-containing protein [Chitinophagaceae bacterium]|nr:molybdopterin cofactor-binding domain-containing protein [Chitinophagaceae bacterium]
MPSTSKIPRREFIGLAAASGAILALGYIPSTEKKSAIVNLLMNGVDPVIELNPYIFISSTGKITIFNHRPEMGQGTFQAIPMILAEELEADIEKISIEQSPANRSKYGDQMVVGSRSIQNNYTLMRKMGAAAKEMLIHAAAAKWKVNADECYAERAMVFHPATGKKLSYGELVEDASKLTAPQHPKLKDPATFKIIGKSPPRMDIPLKINGEAKYGIDFTVPGMLYATVEHSPVFLGKLVSFNDAKTKKIPGVKYVLRTRRDVRGTIRDAVAVIATSYWAAEEGRKVLETVWDNEGLDEWDTEKIWDDYKKAAAMPGEVFMERGRFNETFETAVVKIEASYQTPYQAHACMEPMNATVSVEQDRCIFWGSTQNPNGVKSFLSKQLGLPEEKIIINYTFMGGGFGRRSMTDVAEEAADLSKKAGAPVKLIWNREEDITQGPFRACSLNTCRGAVDAEGNIIALEHKVICQDINNQTGDNMKASQAIAGGINREYAIPNYRLCGVLRKHYVPITYWRSVYHSTNCFAHESFIDELAHAAKKDPLDFRLALLKEHKRYTEVLKTVAEKSGWYGPRKKDSGKGVAIVERSGAFVAMVVEVQRINGKIKPVRITAAIDCGIPVNPDIIKAQTEGNIVMGLTSSIKSGLTIEKGRIAENNFHNYKMLEINECPETDVTVIKTFDSPEGAGEGGLPPVGPALANAIFELTGKRIRELPIPIDNI